MAVKRIPATAITYVAYFLITSFSEAVELDSLVILAGNLLRCSKFLNPFAVAFCLEILQRVIIVI